MNKEILWQSDLGDGTYKNPILFADYSDPDVIRVGDTFYMTASSFNYTPGLPILISKDLVNWELKNYAVKNINYEIYKKPAHAKGIWAPAIRYHNEKYWIYYGMPDEGIFVVHTEDPLGEWSEPILVLEGKGYIDPCPFWDEDGNAYVIHAYAKSRIGFKSILGIFPISADGTKAIGEDQFIYDGTKTQPTIEGPKVYKRDGWYYIFAPAGSVKTGWQTVLRSKNIYGPYEEKIVMSQGDTDINGPHQGGLVDTPSGEEWFIHFQDRGLYGRITHLQPVTWTDGWPIIGIDPDENGCGKPCDTYKKPNVDCVSEPKYLQCSDDFTGESLRLQWQWLGNHDKSFYSLSEKEGNLRLYSLNTSRENPPSLWQSPNVLTQKIVCPEFEAETKLDFSGLKENEQAGYVVMGGQYIYVALRKYEGQTHLVYVESFGDEDIREEKVILSKSLAPHLNQIVLRTKLQHINNQVVVQIYYSFDGKEFINTNLEFTPSDHQWVGAKIGLFAIALDNHRDLGYADFEYIKVNT